MDNQLDQETLNAEMSEIGLVRYKNRNATSKDREAELETLYGQRLMRGIMPKFKSAIEDYQNSLVHRNPARYQKDLRDMKPEVVAWITVRAVLDSISHRKPMSGCALFVGARLEDECRCQFLLETNEGKAKGILKGAKKRKGLTQQVRHLRSSMKNETAKEGKPEFQKWSHRCKLNAGLHLVEILRHSTGMIEYAYILKRKGHKPTRYVTATQETLTWIEDFNASRELMQPFWMPTVELPKPWENIWDGGYDSTNTSLPLLPFIKTNKMTYLRSLDSKRLSSPMEAANLIQQTPWTVNSPILDVMDWAWENNVNVGGLPSREDESLPPIPSDMEENEQAKRLWKKQAARTYEFNLSTKSQRLLIAKILFLAKKFNKHRFFYPTTADFRGRLYNVPSFLGVQGPDVCRALLEFHRPERLKTKADAKWLAIHGANVAGFDKYTLEDREKWAYTFGEDAIRIASDPKNNTDWMDMDKPWSALAWCFEWAKWIKNGVLDTRLPCAMDASNNGLQILSLLMRDELGAASTNVSQTDKPADIYGVVSDAVLDYLRHDAAEGSDTAKTWLAWGVDRKTTKRAVMTYFYGATYYSCRQYTDEWYEDCYRSRNVSPPFDDFTRYDAVGYLAKLIWRGINEVLEKPKECMTWLHKCAKAVSATGEGVNWTSPSGFPVYQFYHNVAARKVSSKLYGQGVHIYFEKELDSVSPRLQRQGIAPNFVHSIDAAMLHLSVIKANQNHGIYDFSMIHDSYGTHSNKCEAFGETLRGVFADTFRSDLLADFKNEVENNAGVTLPELPTYGKLETEDVRHSTYFFS